MSAANTAKSSKSAAAKPRPPAAFRPHPPPPPPPQPQQPHPPPQGTRLPPPIVALPSMSSHLFSLPLAKNMDALPVHKSHSAQRHAESEAKLRKALEWNAARQNTQPATMPAQYPSRSMLPPPIYSEPSSPSSHSPPLMMRKRPKQSGG